MPRSNSLGRCPQCGVDLEKTKEALRDIAELTFCLECHFPVMLVAGKYRLRKLLAQGGFGKVYQARHVHLDREPERVIKILDHDVFKIKGMESRFRREVQVTGALSQLNEHIVRIYDDFGEIPKLGYFYVMEHLHGQPMTSLLANPKKLPSLRLCFHIFAQLCNAMEAAHAEGVVHRDIKPDNIFLVERKGDPYFVKVLDFGIAKPMDREALQSTQMTQGTLGTPPYMSPEQCHDDVIDHRSDIYAMGVTLYELLVGRTPFFSKATPRSALRILQDHLTSPPPSLRELRPDRDIPEAVEAIVLQALSKKPAERFDSAERFKQALAEAYTASGLTLPPGQAAMLSQEIFHPQAELVSAETWDMPRHDDWPVADSTSFPKRQLPHMEGADGFASIESGAHRLRAQIDTGAAAHTGDQLPPQDALKRTGNAHSNTDQHPINRELPVDSRAIHRDSGKNPPVPEHFVSYDSGRYNIPLASHDDDQDDLDDDDELQIYRSYRPLFGALGLLLLGSVWAVMILSSGGHRGSKVDHLMPQAGAICGTKKNAWRKDAVKLLVLPLVSERVPVTLDVKARVRWQRMRALHKRSIDGIKKAVGVLGRDFLSIHESRKGLDQPAPSLNHQRAQMYGELCRADIVLSGGWLTTSASPTPRSPTKQATAPAAWLRSFASFTGRPPKIISNGHTLTMHKPHDFDELIQTSAKQFPGPRVTAMLNGMVALQAARQMAKSRYLSSYLLHRALVSLKQAQLLTPGDFSGLKVVEVKAAPARPMVHVPAGHFWMGPADKAEKHYLPGFWIDQYEVSREAYAACVLQGKCPALRGFLSKEWMLPRDRVTTKAAEAFCAFEGKELPTEKQWVKAARGGIQINEKPNPWPKREYPWGNAKHSCKYAHASRCFRDLDGKDLIATMIGVRRKLKGISPYGAHHMLGNAAEILKDGSIKGGSGYAAPVAISWKQLMDQRSGLSWVGFRCVRNH